MLTISDVFAALVKSSRSSSDITNSTHALANAILSRRVKNLYSHLGSQQRSRASATLLMLSHLVSLGPAMGREFIRVFDFGIPALPQLARPLRARKGETTGEAAVRQQQAWEFADPVRRPTRAAFITLVLCLLRSADAQLLPEILRVRPLISGMLQNLSSDPPEVQLEVLKVLQKRVMGPRISIGPAAKSDLFNDSALWQLSNICAAGEEYEETNSGDGHEDGAEEADGEEKNKETDKTTAAAAAVGMTRRKASDLAFQILLCVCIDPQQGVCSTPEAISEFRVLQASSTGALSPGQRRELRWLQRLRPAESARHGELLRAATAHDPSLSAAMLLSLQYSMEPMATGKWLVHAGIVGSLIQNVAKVDIGLRDLAERYEKI